MQKLKNLKKNCQVFGVSVDSHHTLRAWRDTPVKEGGIGAIKHPVVADLSKNISRQYGVLFNEEVSLRGLFLADKDGIIRHSLVNDLPLGRNVDEALRVLDALQYHEENGEVCPANWTKGAEAMQATPEGVASYLAKNKKYLAEQKILKLKGCVLYTPFFYGLK